MRVAADNGSVLIASLWVVATAAIVAGAMIAVARPPQTVARHDAENLRRALHIQKGIVLSIEGVLGQGDGWQANASRDLIVDGMPLRLMIEDEAGKFDLNSVTDDLLRQALTVVSQESAQRERLADAIADWRDADTARRLQGAEAVEYAAAGRPYGPSNRPLQSVAELQRVLGISAQTYWRLAPLTTVYTQRTGVDIGVAPAAVLELLPGMNAVTVRAILAERRAALSDMRGIGRTITVLGSDRATPATVWMAVVRLSGVPGRPFEVLLWHRADERLLQAS